MLPPKHIDGKSGGQPTLNRPPVAHTGPQERNIVCDPGGQAGHGGTLALLGHHREGDIVYDRSGVRRQKGGQGEGRTEQGREVSSETQRTNSPAPTTGDIALNRGQYLAGLVNTYNAVAARGKYNFSGTRIRVPSGLRINNWRRYLVDYADKGLTDYLEFGWPINFDRAVGLQPTLENHASATNYAQHVDFYVETELGHGALAGPFDTWPVKGTQISPLMTKPKKDSTHRRVIMDLSWPQGYAVNEGVDGDWYIDGEATVRLPTVDYMQDRLLALGPGAFMYKTDLARGYRQLRVDPLDWPILGFMHRGKIYLDICPPFGLKSAAMCMQRTSEAICFIHSKKGYRSRPYLDDFGGAETYEQEAGRALHALQQVMAELGVVEAKHKVCEPSTKMVWLGIHFDSVHMTMRIPKEKMEEIMAVLREWEGRTRASQRELQSILGLLQFVASVSSPTRIFTNRMLQCLRDTPRRGWDTLSAGFRRDLKFFLRLLPQFNGIKIMSKGEVVCQAELELDACLSGCGAYIGPQYYGRRFPRAVLAAEHPIAHLETLNVVVATKLWSNDWAGQKVRVWCDNANACLAIQSGRSRDEFLQSCVRELFLVCAARDIELHATHRAGRLMARADALSRMHLGEKYRRRVAEDTRLQAAVRIEVHDDLFVIDDEW